MVGGFHANELEVAGWPLRLWLIATVPKKASRA
jgi:hypothetical protein